MIEGQDRELLEATRIGSASDTDGRREDGQTRIDADALTTILESAPYVMILVNSEGRVENINRAGTRFAGQSKEQVLGLLGGQVFRCLNSFDAPGCGRNAPCAHCPVRTRVARTFETGEPIFDAEGRLTVLQGDQQVELALSISTARLKVRNADKVLVTIADVTERWRAELQREAAIEALRISEAQARHYAAELERSNHDLEQFAYAVSHDLLAPLRAVMGLLSLAEDDSEGRMDAQSAEFVHMANEEASRMHRMCQALLDLSRVSFQGQALAPTDCEAVLAHVLQILQPAIAGAGATVTHDPLPSVVADAMQLERVLQNLVANALKFRRPDEPPRVHVAAERQDDTWRFSVQDAGIGLNMAQAERIFLVFQRLHTLQEYPGLGMGLSICKRIVERHGGRIWVESAPGQGATFFFTLPP